MVVAELEGKQKVDVVICKLVAGDSDRIVINEKHLAEAFSIP